LRVFENNVFKRIYCFKREEATPGWRKLDVEELRNSYCSPNIKV
jgi:hypothetical protein